MNYRPDVARLPVFIAAMSVAGAGVADSAGSELEGLLGMLPGEYAGVATLSDGEARRLAHRITPIQLPQFGERVLYYQLSEDAANASALQQKLFVLEQDAGQPGIRMRAYYFPPGRFEPNLDRRPEDWRRLDPSQLMSFPDSCAFRWRAEGNTYRGVVKRTLCQFDSPAFGQVIQAEMQYRVTERTFEWTEDLYGADGTSLATTGGNLIFDRR